MAKKWYPVIDILTCMECGSCVAECTRDVYDRQKAPVPVVKNPGNCIDHCRDCGNLCPVGAISYVGDSSGWASSIPSGSAAEAASCCPAGTSGKEIRIEYLYLDLKTCDRCIGTDGVLDEVVEVLRPALELAGYRVNYRKQEVSTAEIAAHYRFLSSPTILVNGQDIFDTVTESDCGCCGEIAGVQVDCRVFAHNGKTYEVPTKEMLAEGILRAIWHPTACACEEYRLPENLKRFFEGKQKMTTDCCCGGSCGCC